MTALAYICLFIGAWTLACGVLRLVDKLEGRDVKKTCRWHVFSPDRGGYHGSPCVKDCPDRGAGCAAHCPHGYAEWRAERDALYALRSAQAEKKYILDAGAKQQRDKYYRHQHNHGRR